MSLWTATPVEASRELSVYHDISHVREALAARQLLCWSRGLMFAIVGGQFSGEFGTDMVRGLVPRWFWHGKRAVSNVFATSSRQGEVSSGVRGRACRESRVRMAGGGADG